MIRNYNSVVNQPDCMVDVVIRSIDDVRSSIKAQAFPELVLDNVPSGKYAYIARHSDKSLDVIESLKTSQGFTCNFWGTIVTDTPIKGKRPDNIKVRITNGRKTRITIPSIWD